MLRRIRQDLRNICGISAAVAAEHDRNLYNTADGDNCVRHGLRWGDDTPEAAEELRLPRFLNSILTLNQGLLKTFSYLFLSVLPACRSDVLLFTPLLLYSFIPITIFKLFLFYNIFKKEQKNEKRTYFFMTAGMRKRNSN